MKPRRKLAVHVGQVTVDTAWRDAALIIDNFSAAGNKRVVIEIQHPYDLAELRRRLDEIEAHWHKMLEGAKP